MAGTALDKVAGYLDKRFVLTALFPALLFWLSLLVLVSADHGWSEALNWWTDRDKDEQRLLIVGVLALIVFSASLLSVQIGAITKLFEGYWGGGSLGEKLAWPLTQLQLRRFSRLDPNDDEDFERRYRLFPRSQDALLPTRFGNVLKGAEEYPADVGRYGLDAVFFWPRLYPVLSEPVRSALAEARASMDLMLATSFLAWLYATVSAFYLALGGGTGEAGLVAVIVPVAFGWLAYLGAVRAAVVFAEQVRSAFDLHRLDLLDQLGYERPTSLEAEQRIWVNLSQRLYRRGASDEDALKYVPASKGDLGPSS